MADLNVQAVLKNIIRAALKLPVKMPIISAESVDKHVVFL
jgi:hypothetical protein